MEFDTSIPYDKILTFIHLTSMELFFSKIPLIDYRLKLQVSKYKAYSSDS